MLGHQAFWKAEQEGQGGGVERTVGQARQDGSARLFVVNPSVFTRRPALYREDGERLELGLDASQQLIGRLPYPGEDPWAVEAV